MKMEGAVDLNKIAWLKSPVTAQMHKQKHKAVMRTM